jgi:tetratricopeptide (TPR) repeat protein
MTEALYERYKDALRRGHIAALHGHPKDALKAYGEAAVLAPDRALPLIGVGTALAKLGKHGEALAAFDAALERGPSDETALRGRADALAAGGDAAAAATTFDELARVLDAAGRHADALDAARGALERAESRSRRAHIRSMIGKLEAGTADPVVAEAVSRARGVLDARVGAPSRGGVARPIERSLETDPGPDPGPETAPEPEPEPEPEPPPPPPPPPFDPAEAFAAVEAAADGDDLIATRDLALVATAGHRAAGQPHAAIDVCYLALATSPADPGLHLALAELYLDFGWRATAAEKLALLARLAELADDTATRDTVCAVVAERLPDEPRLTAICA